jgi:hypothetical protein
MVCFSNICDYLNYFFGLPSKPKTDKNGLLGKPSVFFVKILGGF